MYLLSVAAWADEAYVGFFGISVLIRGLRAVLLVFLSFDLCVL